MIGNFESYHAHFEEVKDQLIATKLSLEQHSDIIQSAIEKFETEGAPTHTWDAIAGQNIQDCEDMLAEGTEDHPDHALLDPSGYQHLTNHNVTVPASSIPAALAIEGQPDIMPDDAYCSWIQSLNDKQKEVFDQCFHWCQNRVKSKKYGSAPDPFYIFVSGMYISKLL